MVVPAKGVSFDACKEPKILGPASHDQCHYNGSIIVHKQQASCSHFIFIVFGLQKKIGLVLIALTLQAFDMIHNTSRKQGLIREKETGQNAPGSGFAGFPELWLIIKEGGVRLGWLFLMF